MTIAFFDFDGTITDTDTLWQIIRFQKGNGAMYRGVLQLLPGLLQLKLKLIPAQQMKEKVLRHFFAGMKESDFQAGCNAFCEEALPKMIRPQALKAIREHQQAGHEVVVVTASAYNWVAPWCQRLNIRCIGSLLEVTDEAITGKLQGINCNGEEKVNRIKQVYHLNDYTEIYAYGDSSGDKPMLALAGNKSSFRPFRN
ncbi:HAD family hydrolase [Chitinophaga sp. Cy-1792]|uniref:HAD family hydrolase n=1 Tax=Chitinophaga sp. Cy-1792 TaxID=2608339 RepID=UPI0014218BF1|nr:HAD family hydrolase [Chitinophaga sp. Cy-1792]NIG56193.1 haloacid dehalogenase-like hydrolase [Chitinophaga sp. Cy-1792]